MKNVLFVLLFCFAGLSCTSKSDKLEPIPSECFTIPIYKTTTNWRSSNGFYHDFYGNICQNYYFKERIKCTSDTNYHIFKNNNVEIEFSRKLETNPFRMARCFIGIDGNDNAFYMYWTNKPYDSVKLGTVYSYYVKWEICGDTDTLYSNLGLNTIKKFFKEFNGYYEKKNIKSITIDNSYLTYEIQFYNNVKFDGFNLGYTIFPSVKRDSVDKIIDYLR